MQLDRKVHGLSESEWWKLINSEQAKDWPRTLGHDKGFAAPSAYVFLHYVPPLDVVVVSQELVLRKYINENEVLRLKDEVGQYTHRFGTCYDPPDSPKDTEEMNHYSRKHGLGIYFQVIGEHDKQERDVFWGIGLMRGYIAKGRFVILGSKCVELIDCLSNYHLKESSPRLGPEKASGFDHLPDACRYGLVGLRWEIEVSRKKLDHKLKAEEEAGKPKYPDVITPPHMEKKPKSRRRVRVRSVSFGARHG